MYFFKYIRSNTRVYCNGIVIIWHNMAIKSSHSFVNIKSYIHDINLGAGNLKISVFVVLIVIDIL